MTLARFDGRVREAFPSMGRWLTASVAVTIVYWLACMYALNADLMLRMMQMPFTDFSPVALVLANLPFLFALGLAWPFGLAERSFRTWLILIVAARLMTGFGYFAALVVAGFLGL